MNQKKTNTVSVMLVPEQDKIFLLSDEDVTNPDYGFNRDSDFNDPARVRLSEGQKLGWWLQPLSSGLGTPMYMMHTGHIETDQSFQDNDSVFGVCPVLYLNLNCKDVYSLAGRFSTDGTMCDIILDRVRNPRLYSNTMYDCIYFGHYPQSDADNPEPIKWRVLSVKDGVALLHADQSLDVQPFHKTKDPVSWYDCTLRSWLNGYGPEKNACHMDYTKDNFINQAFTREEQKAIVIPGPVRELERERDAVDDFER